MLSARSERPGQALAGAPGPQDKRPGPRVKRARNFAEVTYGAVPPRSRSALLARYQRAAQRDELRIRSYRGLSRRNGFHDLVIHWRRFAQQVLNEIIPPPANDIWFVEAMIPVRREDQVEGLVRLDQLIDELNRVRRMHVVVHVAVH